MSSESCSICGGDRRYTNAFGSTTACPACCGMSGSGIHDVTKTKPEHYRKSNIAQGKLTRPQHAISTKGIELENVIKTCTKLSNDSKKKLIDQVIDFELERGGLTDTFKKKIKKIINNST